MFLYLKIFISFITLIASIFFAPTSHKLNPANNTDKIVVESASKDISSSNPQDKEIHVTRTKSIEAVPKNMEEVHENVVKVKDPSQVAKEAKEAVKRAQVNSEMATKKNPTNVVNNNSNKQSPVASSVSVKNNTTNPSSTTNNGSTRASAASAQLTSRHDGFSFNGRNFPIKSYTGLGVLPADNFVYQWTTLPSHFLIERSGQAGGYINQLYVNNEVYIQNKKFKIVGMKTHVPNNNNALNVLKQGYQQYQATVSWQTCESSDNMSSLTIWYAK